jgi:hypothetical protein
VTCDRSTDCFNFRQCDDNCFADAAAWNGMAPETYCQSFCMGTFPTGYTEACALGNGDVTMCQDN